MLNKVLSQNESKTAIEPAYSGIASAIYQSVRLLATPNITGQPALNLYVLLTSNRFNIHQEEALMQEIELFINNQNFSRFLSILKFFYNKYSVTNEIGRVAYNIMVRQAIKDVALNNNLEKNMARVKRALENFGSVKADDYLLEMVKQISFYINESSEPFFQDILNGIGSLSIPCRRYISIVRNEFEKKKRSFILQSIHTALNDLMDNNRVDHAINLLKSELTRENISKCRYVLDQIVHLWDEQNRYRFLPVLIYLSNLLNNPVTNDEEDIKNDVVYLIRMFPKELQE
ncbi:MAG: hypothetical protein A2Y40_09435 [Candidatus Margulisbacteria bacterium GWF2_35_9]|nr:MAG: hypothetical protein A2Y40_09435 [Candidatus Margulisbacteria bacterium GWF2_35_9]